MKKLLIIAALCLLQTDAPATITINIDAELLKTAGGAAMPSSGLVILAASTLNSTFGSPTGTSFVSGDDIELKRWNLTLGGAGFGDGILGPETTGSLTLSGDWNAGDPLQMFWFPTLTIGSSTPGVGISYGLYRHDTGLNGSASWTTPADGSTISLKFFTTDALINTGSNAADTGLASLTTVPEPSSYAAAFGVLCLGGAIASRRLRSRQSHNG